MIDLEHVFDSLRDHSPVASAGLGSITERARRIRRRTAARWASAGLAAAAVLGVAVGVVTTSSSRPTHVVSLPPTPVPSTPAPGGLGRLAVATPSGVDIIDGQHRVHIAAPGAWGLAWSADGSTLAYRQGQSGNLWLATPDGRSQPLLRGTPIDGFAWSPAGATIAVEPGSGGLSIDTPAGQVTPLVGPDFFVSSVAWSPDGRAIAYAQSFPAQSAGPAARTDRVYTRPVPGAGAATLVYTAPAGDGALLGAWWPNARGLYLWPDPLHSSSIAADGLDLLSVPFAGGAAVDLGTTLPTPRSLAFSPDGSQVMVMTGGWRFINQAKALELCPVGSNACTAVPQPAGSVAVEPAWSPDGMTVAFVGGAASDNPDPSRWLPTTALYIDDVRSGTVRQLQPPLHGVTDPEFSADGRDVLYQQGTGLWELDLTTGTTVRLADGLSPPMTQWMGVEPGANPAYAWHRSPPTPGPAPTATAASTQTGARIATLAALRQAAATPPLLPGWLPAGLALGPIQAWRYDDRGRVTAFTITYLNAHHAPALQFYEAPASYPNARYVGAAVVIRPGLTGTYNSSLPVLWWVENSTYCAIQAGGPVPIATRLAGGATQDEIVRVAASVSP